MKNKRKILGIFIGLFFIIVISLFYTKSVYTVNKYFLENEKYLYEIVQFIEKNKLEGYIDFESGTMSGSIGSCFTEVCYNMDISLYEKLKQISTGISYNNEGFIVIHLDDRIDKSKYVWLSEEAELVYKREYFKNKKIGFNNQIHGDESGITHIFNDDWGVTTWCFGCYGGAWD